MKWIYIKSDDDLPKKDGLYHVEYFVDNFGNGKSWALCKSTQRSFKGKWLSLDVSKIKDLKFLDESTPSHGRTAEEIDISNLTDEFKADYIDACSDNRKLRKMLAEVTGLSRIATVEEYASQFKTMEEHRTQPQEGRDNLPVFIEKIKEAKERANKKYKKSLETIDIHELERRLFVQELYRIQQETLSFTLDQAELILSNSQPLPNTVPQQIAEEVKLIEGKWKIIGHSHQIADTGDYDGCWEITDGTTSIFTASDDEQEMLYPIVNALNESGLHFYTNDEKEYIFHLEQQIKSLTVPQDDGWVRVEDTPDNSRLVLCGYIDEFPDNSWVVCGEYNADVKEWSNQFDSSDIIYPTHWMELPPPPVQ